MIKTIISWITGHHVYKGVWSPVIGEELRCRPYRGNARDPTAIGVFLGELLVGHVPREHKEEIWEAVRRGKIVTATVTGRRENTRRRGLEIPARFSYPM